MTLAHHVPLNLVDNLLVREAKLRFGDLSRHGITMPKMGPMTLKSKTGRSAVIDVGTVGLIKKGNIRVSISSGMMQTYVYNKADLLCRFINIFFTSYRSKEASVRSWAILLNFNAGRKSHLMQLCLQLDTKAQHICGSRY
jgi:hypothetical protein